MAEPLGIVTIAAPNYFAHVRVLMESLRRFHPNVPFHLLVVSPKPHPFCFPGQQVRCLSLAELPAADRRSLLLRYGPKQLCAALKPGALRRLLDNGHRSALFLDPDMLVLAGLDDCLAQVERHALTLTPHLVPAHLCRAQAGLERELVMVGTFNGGFIGVTDGPQVRRFLNWWESRLRTHCFEDLAAGMHYDQRWLDLAPGFVEDLRLLSDPGVNFGHWRLPALRIEKRNGEFFVEGRPLRLVHFSGYDPSSPEGLSRFRPGWRIEQFGPLAGLFRDYTALLLEAGWDHWRQFSWELPPRLRLAQRLRQALERTRTGTALLVGVTRSVVRRLARLRG